MSERPFSQGGPLVVAHRGSPATVAENTLEGFEDAIDAGADVIEFDVRLTSNGHPVVMHDATVDRTTDGSGVVRSMTLAQVGALRIATADGDAQVPTLERTLRALSGRVAIDVEIKNIPGEPDFDGQSQPVVDATIAALDATGFSGPVMLTSFNPWAIARARERSPELMTALMTGLLTDPSVEAHVALGFAREQGHAWVLPYVGMVQDAGPGYPAAVHDAGLSLGTWVVDDPATAVALMRSGVDAVATNDPRTIVQARRASFGA